MKKKVCGGSLLTVTTEERKIMRARAKSGLEAFLGRVEHKMNQARDFRAIADTRDMNDREIKAYFRNREDINMYFA